MERRDSVMAIFWILLGLTISIWSATFPFGGLKDPGPAFLPLGCGLILILLGSIMVFQVRTRNADLSTKPFERLLPQGAAGMRVAFTMGSMLLSTILLTPLGFVLTVFFLILFLMRTIHPQKWRVAIFYAFVSAVGSFIVFKVLLKTQLPGGFLGL
ncbi:MAG: tripartite tricarboxylate transporter TctB family protein [Deltaproteobacteria bacterium]